MSPMTQSEIKDLVVHPKYELKVNGVLVRTYTADFKYTDKTLLPGPNRVVEDVKSKPTSELQDFRMVKKLMLAVYGIDLKVVIK